MPAIDDFKNNSVGITSPVTDGESVTPSDATELSKVSRAIYVGVGGDLKYVTIDGTTLSKKNIASGLSHPMRVRQILATGTTATDIIAEW